MSDKEYGYYKFCQVVVNRKTNKFKGFISSPMYQVLKEEKEVVSWTKDKNGEKLRGVRIIWFMPKNKLDEIRRKAEKDIKSKIINYNKKNESIKKDGLMFRNNGGPYDG